MALGLFWDGWDTALKTGNTAEAKGAGGGAQSLFFPWKGGVGGVGRCKRQGG